MAEITNHDLFLAITEVANTVKEINVRLTNVEGRLTSLEGRVSNLETEIKEMRTELKEDIRKVDKKVTLLSNDLLEAKADISILQEERG